MCFRLLGPLEVLRAGRPVPLGGTKQRAVLGHLLLNANRVVSTRELLDALWVDTPLPTTARKIVQNAVWALRGALAAPGAERQDGVLLTRAPGYVMQVDPDRVDLHLFHRRIQEGRAALASGSAAQAADILRDALSLWRGRALADLVENGIDWPELATVESARLDAMEDYFEAELHCGRHRSILRPLEFMVEAEPLRERLCGQLMLALYRSGRQADALSVYNNVRASLIGDLGLEPRRELQFLQQAILNQDSGLSLPEPTAPVTAHADAGRAQDHLRMVAPGRPATAVTALPSSPEPSSPAPRKQGEGTSLETSEAGARTPVTVPRPSLVHRHRPVSVLLLKARLRRSSDGDPPRGTDELRDSVTDRIQDLVERFDGSVISSIGAVQLAVFGPRHMRDNYAERAVRAAMTIRDEFHEVDAVVPLVRPARRTHEVALHAAVSTGEVSLRYAEHGSRTPRSADGTPLDECQSLLSQTRAGEVRVCRRTRQMTASALSYTRGSDWPHTWKVDLEGPRDQRTRLTDMVDREIELDVLRGMLERVRHRGTPHVVTVLGTAGIGKSRLLREFERRAMGQPTAMRFLVPCGPDREQRSSRDSQLFDSRMSPVFDPHGAETGKVDLPQVLRSVQDPLPDGTQSCPLVMVIDNLHEVDDTLLDFVGGAGGEPAAGPLLIVAAARPELFARRPGWGGGTSHFTTLSIDPPFAGSAARRADRRTPGFADCTT